MTNASRFASALVVCLVFLAFGSSRARPDEPPAVTVDDKELLDELKSAPRDNQERERRLVDLYRQAGAKDEQIELLDVPTDDKAVPKLRNVVVTKKGKTDAVIVVGGHLDKVGVGDGVIDDWSGACLASNLYQTLRPMETQHTFVFIGFAHEERGLVGSKRFVTSLAPGQKERIRAMINLECLGVDGPFLWTNGSTDSLEALAHRVADGNKLPLKDHVIRGVGADSIPFERAGIPVLTFDGLPQTQFRLIHSKNDTFENVRPDSYVNAYQLAWRFLVALDREPEAARPDKPKETDRPQGKDHARP